MIGSSVGFVLGELVDMDGPFFSEYLDDFALGTLSTSSEDDNFVLFADGERPDPVFLA